MNFIYCYENKLNHHKYVGQTNNLKVRYSAHKSQAFNPNSKDYNCLFHKKIRQYGLENFDFYCLEEINKSLERYKLKLNKKTKIYSCKEGFEFLGFRYIIKNNKVIMKVKNSTKKRFKRKIKVYNKLLKKDKLSEFDYNQVLASYKGHLSYGNTNNLVYSNLSNGAIKL